MKTKKTRREDKGLWILVIILIAVLSFSLIVWNQRNINLKTQLSECQEQVEVWTLKIICYHTDYLGAESYNVTYESSHTNYQNYLNHLESIEELENCEVIE